MLDRKEIERDEQLADEWWATTIEKGNYPCDYCGDKDYVVVIEDNGVDKRLCPPCACKWSEFNAV